MTNVILPTSIPTTDLPGAGVSDSQLSQTVPIGKGQVPPIGKGFAQIFGEIVEAEAAARKAVPAEQVEINATDIEGAQVEDDAKVATEEAAEPETEVRRLDVDDTVEFVAAEPRTKADIVMIKHDDRQPQLPTKQVQISQKTEPQLLNNPVVSDGNPVELAEKTNKPSPERPLIPTEAEQRIVRLAPMPEKQSDASVSFAKREGSPGKESLAAMKLVDTPKSEPKLRMERAEAPAAPSLPPAANQLVAPIAPAIVQATAVPRVATEDGDDSRLIAVSDDFAPSGNSSRTETAIVAPKMETTAPTARQITQQVAYAITQNGSGTTEIKLSPEELGRVRMMIQAAEGVVNITIVAERAEVGEVMRRNSEMLTEQLRSMGFEDINLTFGNERQPAQSEGDAGEALSQAEPDQFVEEQAPANRSPHIISETLDIRL